MKTQQQIRKSFLDFFASKGHTIVPSSLVIPAGDPTLLFTNAGMNQFKPYFLGSKKPEFTRAADTQKCLRVSGKHNDLEEVGRDTYHHTFFEMLGNWSFGDYFKKEAIIYAWEFLTEVCGLDKDRLYATYFQGDEKDGVAPDEESASLWRNCTDIPKDHVLPFGKKENFWEMGDVGPCGPCSEIHIDLGVDSCERKHEKDHICRVNGDCNRFMEIWNLVFIQFNRAKDRTLSRLSKNHVDTGMGFERLTAVLQGKLSNYDTDLFTPLLDKIEEITGVKYGFSSETDVAMRVCADHIKALSFAIADGAVPDKKGRGSVLRSLARRASRFGMQRLGMKEPFLYKLSSAVAEIYADIFPELFDNLAKISQVLFEEEELFIKTLEQGLVRFNELVEKSKGSSVLNGFEAYRLYHQDGFPKDLILQMASEKHMTIDENAWNQAELEHKERSKSESKELFLEPQRIADLPVTAFKGYWEDKDALCDGTKFNVKPLRLLDNKFLVLDSTPFYAQSGGQIGDIGTITGDGFLFEVNDTKKLGDFIIHCGTLKEGDAENLPETALAEVDYLRRKSLSAAHTATHLLHWALKEVLGGHVNQKGSEVSPDYLRFDISHPKQISQDELNRAELLVNEKIRDNQAVNIYWKDLDEAKKDGATALFGEKYSKVVRVIDIGNYSKELCGGTHCKRTGDIGSFRILSESSSEAGVRRIEAATGSKVLRYAFAERNIIKNLSKLLACNSDDIFIRVESLNAQIKELKKLRQAEEKKDLGDLSRGLYESGEKIGSITLIVKKLSGLSAESLGFAADDIRSRDSAVGTLVSECSDAINVVGFASKNIAGKDKINMGNYVKECCRKLGGGGGGRFDFAKGGGKDASKIDGVLEDIKEKIKSDLLKII